MRSFGLAAVAASAGSAALQLPILSSAAFQSFSPPSHPRHRRSPPSALSVSNDDAVADYSNEDVPLQVLRFTEPSSGRPVVLVGCMHYNPASIERAKRMTDDLGSAGALHSVLVESCPSRFRGAAEFRESLRARGGPFLEGLYDAALPNEMQAAARVANEYGRPIVLADQDIEVTGRRIREVAVGTVRDLASPLEGGWSRIGSDLTMAFDVIASSFGVDAATADRENETGASADGTTGGGKKRKDRLTLADYLDWKLMGSMPLSFVRYPLSIAVRYPPLAIGVSVFLSALDRFTALAAGYASHGGSFAMQDLGSALPFASSVAAAMQYAFDDQAYPASSWAITILIAILETLVFGRVFVIPILAERDAVLARSIVTVANNGRGGARTAGAEAGEEEELRSVRPFPNGLEAISRIDFEDEAHDTGAAVVAVLGMAHVNGVRDIILEGRLKEEKEAT